MRLNYMSDLHLESNQFMPQQIDARMPEGDVLALVGDIFTIATASRLKYLPYFLDKARERHEAVFAVPGNHEWYRTDRGLLPHLRAIYKEHGIQLLEKETVEFQGFKIYGATFWTDMDKGNPLAFLKAKDYLNDFWIINDFSPEASARDHAQALALMGEPDIVLSHHAPSWKSVHPRYANEGLGNNCYYSNIDVPDSVKLWVHGHMHDPVDYQLNNARVVSNPRGYSHESTGFNWDAHVIL